ncbi:hypothetical protein CALVIDRAFT_394809 [Calocera viscosa TUFC12733]|uniref:AAA+ ATPase domain-containing protein n=1 Tax=Calocera viscosa (strain TUFC12733) TaxID=1330018 RepID=A0A167GC24_CALVF|nr:hypothetical protein CALVIDRAFT_394809 [Calocera viscosa TUFC12733]
MKMFSKMQMGNSNTDDTFCCLSSTSTETTPCDFPLLQLPRKPEIFHGREAVSLQLKNSLLQDEGTRIAILGTGGIGKTTIAAIMLHDVDIEAKFGTRRIFIRCEAMTSADGIISGLAAALDITADNRSDLLRSVVQYLRETKAPILLVLDNFETPWDSADQDAVEETLGHLDTVEHLSFVVTMRGTKRPGCVKWSQPALTSLDPVGLLAARMIYLENGGQDGEGLDHLLRFLDGLPLAIVLLAYHGQNCSPTELSLAYEAERTELLNRGRRTRLTSLEVSISFTLNSQTMEEEPNALEALRLLSLLPDGVEIEELPGVFPNLARRGSAIRTLQDTALLSRYGSRYKVLAPIREYIQAAQEPAGPLLLDVRSYYFAIPVDQLNGWFQNPQDFDLVQRITQVYGNIRTIMIHALSRSELSHHLFSALKSLSLVAQMSIYSADCLQLLDAAVASAQGLPAFKGELHSMWKLKSIVHQIRHEREAAAVADAAIAALEEAAGGESETELQVMSSGLSTQPKDTYSLAKWHRNKGNLGAAIRLYTEARHAYEQNDDKYWVAWCCQDLGHTYGAAGQLVESYEMHLRARTNFLAIGRTVNASACLLAMARAQMDGRDFVKAISLFLDSISAFASLGLDYWAAHSQLGCAICYYEMNMCDQAESKLIPAQAQYEKMKDCTAVATCRKYRARCHCQLGRHHEEQVTLRDAIDYCTRNGLHELAAELRDDRALCEELLVVGSVPSDHASEDVL